MWPFLKKYYKIILISAVVLSVFIFAFIWYLQMQELNDLFEIKANVDYSGEESPVVTKLNQLWDETREFPDSAGLWGKLGMNLYIHGYKSQSVPIYKKAASLDENNFRWIYYCGIALDDLNLEEADIWFARGRKINPNYPPLCIKLGNRYLAEGKLSQAKEIFNQAIIKWQNVPHAFVGLAKISIASNELDSAHADLMKAVTMAPNFRDAHVLLADVYRRKGEKADAEKEVQLIEKLPPKLDLKDPFFTQLQNEGVSSFWYQVRGENYLKSGQLDKAVSEYKKVIEMKKEPSFHISLGNVYEKQNKHRLAIDQYQLALEIDPQSTGAMNNLGVVYFKMDKIDTAFSFVRRSLEINPELKDAYLNLGTFYKQLNQRSEAINNFKRGMNIAPDDLRFAYQLSWLLSSSPERHLRDGEEALRLAEYVKEQALSVSPSILDLIAAALAEKGEFEKAHENAKTAYQLAVKTRNNQLAKDIYGRMQLYANNQPFREKNITTNFTN